MKHQHLDIVELLYFITGIINSEGEILQKGLIEKKEYQIIHRKIGECSYCKELAKRSSSYNIINNEAPTKKSTPSFFVGKWIFLLLFLILIEFDFSFFKNEKQINFLTINSNKVKEIHTERNIKREVRIYKNNREIGTISVNENTYLKINDKRCKYNLLHLKKGSIDIMLTEKIPICLLIDKKLIVIYNHKTIEKANLLVTIDVTEEGNIYKSINSINGKFELIVYPEIDLYILNDEETIDLS
ncbi:MAG: hypothetical protein ACK4UJ_10915 [Leptonema sp. (in: bacteria)]